MIHVQMDILIFNPFVESIFYKPFNRASSCREKNQEPGRIGDKTRGEKNNTGDENKKGIDQFFFRHNSLLKTGPDPEHGPQTLHARKVRPCKTCKQNKRHRVEGANYCTHFNKQVEFKKGY